MLATELLESQHRTVEALFERFKKASSEDKPEVFDEIAMALVGHDIIEREIFYPACEEALGEDDDVLGESLVEHEMVELCLVRCRDHRDEEDLEKYVTVLEELVSHHVEEEEKELFKKANSAIPSERLEDLGTKLEQRFAEAQKGGLERPLEESLERLHLQKTPPKRSTKRTRSTKSRASTTSTASASPAARRKAAKKRKKNSTKRRAR